MSSHVLVAVDAVMICLLVFGVHLPRHHRRDMVVSYITVGIGVLAVAVALSISATAAGLGMGLFGVLSIIRLRSEELGQIETAYCFSALALGLLGGVGVPLLRGAPLMAALVLVMAVLDTRRVAGGVSRQAVMLDRAIADEAELRDELGVRLGGRVLTASIRRLDFVNDTTTVDVRSRAGAPRPGAAAQQVAPDDGRPRPRPHRRRGAPSRPVSAGSGRARASRTVGTAGGPGFRGARRPRRPDRAPRRGPGAPVPRRGGCRWWPARHGRPGPGSRRGS